MADDMEKNRQQGGQQPGQSGQQGGQPGQHGQKGQTGQQSGQPGQKKGGQGQNEEDEDMNRQRRASQLKFASPVPAASRDFLLSSIADSNLLPVISPHTADRA